MFSLAEGVLLFQVSSGHWKTASAALSVLVYRKSYNGDLLKQLHYPYSYYI
jgi:hypothetical protein